MAVTLSEGTLGPIMNGAEIKDPVLQILGIKKINSGNSSRERYRLVVSDGKHTISHAMLASQENDQVVKSGEYTVIKVKRYLTSVINNNAGKDQRILLLLDVEIVADSKEVSYQIGNPVLLTDKSKSEVSQSSNTPKPTITPTNNAVPKMSVQSSSNGASLDGQIVHPISSLSPYQNKWVIKARVMSKSSIRSWSNSRGEGKLFSMDLCDESGEIRLTGFREAVDKFYDMIQVDKIYLISKCQLKPANKQYSTLKNDYEMTMTNDTVIQECTENDTAIPQTKYDFISIDKINNMEVGTFVDICAVCKETSDVQTIQARSTGRELRKREIGLVDQSNTMVRATLWGSDADNFDGTNNPVIVIKGAKIGEFGGGKNLSLIASSILKVNPEMPESFRVKGWFEQEGKQVDSVDISARSGGGGSFNTPWMSFKEVRDMGLGNAEKGDYYQTVGTVLMMRPENMIYKACSAEGCNKKVIDLENGMYRCEKCNQEYPDYKFRLLASMNVGDWSGNQWLSMFSSEAEAVIGKTAKQIGEAIEADKNAAAEIAENVNFKEMLFKCRAKMETYNDESRLKTVAVDVKPVNYKEYNSHLISKIKQLMESN